MRELTTRLGPPIYHQWIEYLDANGKGWAEPEAYYVAEDRIILVECKLTGGPGGREQLENLYAPLLSHIYKKPVHCLLICRNVTVETPGPYVASIEDFIQQELMFGTWHLVL